VPYLCLPYTFQVKKNIYEFNILEITESKKKKKKKENKKDKKKKKKK